MGNYLIVGGSSGIGKALAEQLSANGHRVYATYKSTPIDSASTSLSYHQFDALSELLDFSFLPDTLDGFVYCPGSINLRPFSRLKAEDFRNDYELQVVGAVKCIQNVVEKLKSGKAPSILLFSSVAAQLGLNYHSLVASSKAAIEGLVYSLAAEFAPAIRVNAIAPSLTHTPLAASLLNTQQKVEANAQRHAMKRVGEPNDIASMCAFLLSENASWITGQIMPVDGGMGRIRI